MTNDECGCRQTRRGCYSERDGSHTRAGGDTASSGEDAATCCNVHCTSSIQLLTVTSSRLPSLLPCPVMSTLRYPAPHFCTSPSNASLFWLRRTEARPCSHTKVVGGRQRRWGRSWSAWSVRPAALRTTTFCNMASGLAEARSSDCHPPIHVRCREQPSTVRADEYC